MDALEAMRLHVKTRNAWEKREAFLTSSVASILGPIPQWTVSNRDKMPIDMGRLQDDLVVSGARADDPTTTVTLPELVRIMPDARNAAFRLDSETSGLCVLDVEPTCPDKLVEPMFDFPYLWAETSMSGHGIHLVLPVPRAITENGDAAISLAVKDPEKRYEILLCHWVTFTAMALEPHENPRGSMEAWEAFAEDLVARAPKHSQRDSLGVIDINDLPERDPAWRLAVDLIVQKSYPKTPDDFGGDLSRFEFGFLSWAEGKLERILAARNQTMDPEDKAWLLYDCATKVLPWRPKHDEARLGMPWLLYQARNCVATREMDAEKTS